MGLKSKVIEWLACCWIEGAQLLNLHGHPWTSIYISLYTSIYITLYPALIPSHTYMYIYIYTWIFHLRLFSDPRPKSCFFSTQNFFQALLSNSGPGHFRTSMVMAKIGWKQVKTTFSGYSGHRSWSTQIPVLPAQTPLTPQLQHQDWSGNDINNYGISMG